MKKIARTIVAMAGAGLTLLSGPALAGDFSSVQPIGFSANGSVFAFEEFGVQDGSGYPYSNIFVIDTDKDAFLPGTPVRVQVNDDAASLGKARAEAHAKAQALIGQYKLDDNPGLLAAFNPVTELGNSPDLLRYRPFAAEPAVGGPFMLHLDEFPLPRTGKCTDAKGEGVGFRLTFLERDGKAANSQVYEDKAIPESRNCPTAYRLGGVVTYTPFDGPQRHMALVLVLGQGFEGWDGRWIAVPLRP